MNGTLILKGKNIFKSRYTNNKIDITTNLYGIPEISETHLAEMIIRALIEVIQLCNASCLQKHTGPSALTT